MGQTTNPLNLSEAPILKELDWSDDGNLEYAGSNFNVSASVDDTDWIITAYTYDGTGNLIAQQTKTGAWSDRENLF